MLNRMSNQPTTSFVPERRATPLTGQTRTAEDIVHSTSGPGAEAGTSVIGTDLTILGERITIISQNKLQIDGDIRGDVSGRQVTIGPAGSVVGTVSAEKIEVFGGVNGAIRAISIALHPSSKVNGEIVNQTLVISEGAQFEGSVRRASDKNELMPNLDANTYS